MKTHTYRLLHCMTRDLFFHLTQPTKISFYFVFIWRFAAVSDMQSTMAHSTTKRSFHTPGIYRHNSKCSVNHTFFCSQNIVSTLSVFVLGGSVSIIRYSPEQNSLFKCAEHKTMSKTCFSYAKSRGSNTKSNGPLFSLSC